jgi:hypothetical protein
MGFWPSRLVFAYPSKIGLDRSQRCAYKRQGGHGEAGPEKGFFLANLPGITREYGHWPTLYP